MSTSIRLSEARYISPDEALSRTEGFGKYQILVVIASTLALWSNNLYTYCVPFFMMQPKIYCPTPGDNHAQCTLSVAEICKRGIHFDYERQDEDFVSQYNLLCDSGSNAWLTAAVFIGCIPGYAILGWLGDLWGRIHIMMISLVLSAGSLIMIVLVNYLYTSFWCTVVLSGIIGFSESGLIYAPFTFAFESIQKKYVSKVGVFLNVIDTLSQIMIIGILQFGFNWKTDCIILSVITAAALIPLFFLKDPPKYYLSNRNRRESTVTLMMIAKVNGATWNPDWRVKYSDPENDESAEQANGISNFSSVQYDDMNDDDSPAPTKQILKFLFCNKHYKRRFILNTLVVISWAVFYYGNTVDLPTHGGHVLVSATFSFLAEFLACMFSGALLSKFGYFSSIGGGIAVAGAALLGSRALVRAGAKTDLISFLIYLSKFGVSNTFANTMIASDRLFPPKMRNTALTGAQAIAGLSESMVAYFIGGKYKDALDISYVIAAFGGMIAACYLHKS